jgi:hypothetical protein
VRSPFLCRRPSLGCQCPSGTWRPKLLRSTSSRLLGQHPDWAGPYGSRVGPIGSVPTELRDRPGCLRSRSPTAAELRHRSIGRGFCDQAGTFGEGAAWTRFVTASLRRMLVKWTLAVLGLTTALAPAAPVPVLPAGSQTAVAQRHVLSSRSAGVSRTAESCTTPGHHSASGKLLDNVEQSVAIWVYDVPQSG